MRLEKRDSEWERWGRQWNKWKGKYWGWKDTLMNGWDADGGVWENEPNKVCMKTAWICYFISQIKLTQNIQNKIREWEMERDCFFPSFLYFFSPSSLLPSLSSLLHMASHVPGRCYTINLIPQLRKAKKMNKILNAAKIS